MFFVHAVFGVPSVLKTPKNLKSFFLFTRSSDVPSVPKTGKNPIFVFFLFTRSSGVQVLVAPLKTGNPDF